MTKINTPCATRPEHPSRSLTAVASMIRAASDASEEIIEFRLQCSTSGSGFAENRLATPVLATIAPQNHGLRRSSVASTVIEIGSPTDLSHDVVVKPNYTRAFKLKTRSMKLDKSLPKIFID